MNPSPVPGLLRRLTGTPTPLLTWYSAVDGQVRDRIELSGPTLVRWVSKTAHLLIEADAEPGEQVLVALGVDWRAPVFWLAAWHLGLTVALPDGGRERGSGEGHVDLAVVADGDPAPPGVPGDRVVVVARPALARAADHVPAGAVDYAATVTGLPDDAPPPGPAPSPAIVAATTRIGLPEVLTGGRDGRRWFGPAAGPHDIAGTWAAGGSVVWHGGLTGNDAERVRTAEQATTSG
ncbi:MAG: TIGR03089 family protein [Kineosporiaceae bacterium]